MKLLAKNLFQTVKMENKANKANKVSQVESGRDGNYVEAVENGDGTYNIIVCDGETGEGFLA